MSTVFGEWRGRSATIFTPRIVPHGVSKREYPRDVLNRLKWEKGSSLQDVEVVIVHRGGPGDRLKIQGREIISIGHMFFETPDASIPLHRIVEIWRRGERIFEKMEKRKSKG